MRNIKGKLDVEVEIDNDEEKEIVLNVLRNIFKVTGKKIS